MWPTASGGFDLIVVAANPASASANLVQFGVMGSVFSEQVLGNKSPKVALLSIGEEDVKGNDITKEAFKLLKSSSLNFQGNIKGRDLYENPADVVVCDAFTGNLVLKTS